MVWSKNESRMGCRRMMPDREKVIKGLKCCASMNGNACRECPYSSECVDYEGVDYEDLYQAGTAHLAADALALLKDQEARIRSLEQTIEDICCGGGAG